MKRKTAPPRKQGAERGAPPARPGRAAVDAGLQRLVDRVDWSAPGGRGAKDAPKAPGLPAASGAGERGGE